MEGSPHLGARKATDHRHIAIILHIVAHLHGDGAEAAKQWRRRMVFASAAVAQHRVACLGRGDKQKTQKAHRTASKSSGEAMGNPASMMSTPRRASWRAMSSFSLLVSVAPGDCSPSRSVVSNIRTCDNRQWQQQRLQCWQVWHMQAEARAVSSGEQRRGG